MFLLCCVQTSAIVRVPESMWAKDWPVTSVWASDFDLYYYIQSHTQNFNVKLWLDNISTAVYKIKLTKNSGTRVRYSHRYSFWDFHTVLLPVLKCTECKGTLPPPLNWIFYEIHMIKLLAYTLLLCFLLSFKKILPSWTTASGHIRGQCCSDCRDHAAEELRHNRCGLSDAVRLLVHVLKPHPAHLLLSSPTINYTLYCATLLLHLHDYEGLRYHVK